VAVLGESALIELCQAIAEQALLNQLQALVLFIAGCSCVASARDIALISHKSNPVSAMAMPELAKICKGQTNRWPDGKTVTFVTRSPDAPEMKIVVEKVYAMPRDEVSAAIESANRGRVSHPAVIIVSSDEAVVQKVQSTPGAIGLVDVYSITGGVNVLKVGGKLPLEPGYSLHGN
jgi:ABC-type phosphate transport system substrate-binding protein